MISKKDIEGDLIMHAAWNSSIYDLRKKVSALLKNIPKKETKVALRILALIVVKGIKKLDILSEIFCDDEDTVKLFYDSGYECGYDEGYGSYDNKLYTSQKLNTIKEEYIRKIESEYRSSIEGEDENIKSLDQELGLYKEKMEQQVRKRYKDILSQHKIEICEIIRNKDKRENGLSKKIERLMVKLAQKTKRLKEVSPPRAKPLKIGRKPR